MINRGMAERLSQPPPDAVALGRMADLLRDRQAEAQSVRVVAHEALHGHPFSMKAAARSRRQEFAPFGQAARSCAFDGSRARVAHVGILGGQALAAVGAPGCEHLAAALRLHAGTKTMPALANELTRLIGPLHGSSPVARGRHARGLAAP